MGSQVTLKALGLNYSPNNLALPEGSLTIANDVIVRRDNVLESRRGFKEYSQNFGTVSNRSSQLISYKDAILNHYYNSSNEGILQYDTGTLDSSGKAIFADFDGSYLETETGLRIKSVSANKNLYFTTSEGIKKIAARNAGDFNSSSILNSGAVKAIDFTVELDLVQGQSTGFLGYDSACAYRVLWGYKDLNEHLILGSPSDSVSVYNYLSQVCVLDMNALCLALDKLKQNDSTYHSVIHNITTNAAAETFTGSFSDTFGTSFTDTAETIRTNIVGMATNIDRFSNLASTSAITNNKPLKILTFELLNDELIITFDVGNDATKVFTVGDKIEILGAGSPFSSINNTDKDPVTSGNTTTIYRYYTLTGVTATTIKFPFVSTTKTQTYTFTVLLASAAIVGDTYTNNGNTYTITTTKITGTGLTLTATGIANPLASGTLTKASGSGDSTIAFSAYTVSGSTSGNITAATPGSSTNIYSYNYRNIINTIQTDVTSVTSGVFGQTLVGISIPEQVDHSIYALFESNIYAILLRLKSELSNFISTALQTLFLTPLNITSAANTTLTINIPTAISSNPNYFFQIYRTANAASIGNDVLGTTMVPDDEMNLVYESPILTYSDYLPSLQVIVPDTYPDDLRGFNVPLYTNPTTGEGINQANEVPPIAKDINAFKNYVFYANTKTRHRLTPFNLLGTSNIADGDKLLITDGTTTGTTEYTFKLGVPELTTFLFTGYSTIADVQNKYFIVNSANNENSYYFWYRVDNAGTNPNISGKTGIIIDILTGDSLTTIINKTINTINSLPFSFTSSITYFNIISSSWLANILTINTDGKHNLIATQSVTLSNLKDINGNAITNGTPVSGTYTILATPTTTSFTIALTPTTTSNAVSGEVTSTTVNSFMIQNVNEGKADDASIPAFPILTKVINTDGIGEDSALNYVLLSQVSSRAQAIDLTARSLATIINKNLLSPINAYYISSTSTLPGILNLESKALTDIPFYIMASSTGLGSSFNPDISPSSNNITFLRNSNTVTATTTANHGLSSGNKIIICNCSTSDISGEYTISITGAKTFTFTAIGTNIVSPATGSWDILSDVINSTNESKPNRIYYSKLLQPEAVPILNNLDVGSADKAILRIFPLRDSLFVFKEDGLYRISGESAPFVVTLFDSSCILVAPDSVGVANNIIYAWTNKGISNVTESGVSEISRPIDTQILKLASSNYTNFKTITWGVGYDSDNSYTVYTNSLINDTVATIGFRYSNLTNTWTNIQRSQTCGIINIADDKIYTGSGIYNLIDQERKQFSRLDYSDRDFTTTIETQKVTTNGSTIQLPDVTDISIGDAFSQEQILTIYTFNSLLNKLDFDNLGINTYSNNKIIAGANLRTSLLNLATILDTDSVLTSNQYNTSIADKTGSISAIATGTITTITSAGHGLQTGRIVTISGVVSSPNINDSYEVTVISPNQFTIPVTTTSYTSGGSFTTALESQGIYDIAACYNIIIDMLNNISSGTAFKNYVKVSELQLFESVILTVNKYTNIITLNLTNQWVTGEATIYTSIPCEVQYAPVTFQNPLVLKQIYEATLMFNNKAFTKATASFSSDLKPEFFATDFYGQGNGMFGHYSEPGFGFGFFGGESNAAPFRTIIPRETQRCRFINVRFNHSVAREIWTLLGITLTGNASESTRGYR